MSSETLDKAVDFAFRTAQPNERIDFGLFGGEPLLAWERVQQAVALVEQRSNDSGHDVRMSLVTNGTLLDEGILGYLRDHRIILQVSCDGVPRVQDSHRRFLNKKPSSAVVQTNLLAALRVLPAVLVNVVYGPDTYSYLPQSIEYLASLGLRQIVLNPDYSAKWQPEHISELKQIYDRIAEIYLNCYKGKDPLFISLIDEKIAVILRGGYEPSERCHMGYEEFAFSPDGYIFPCERLVGDGLNNQHCIGHLNRPRELTRSHCHAGGTICRNTACQQCSVAAFCMNWCGCTNYHATGDYSLASYFICSSERLAIKSALNVLSKDNDEQELAYINHYVGLPMLNSSINPSGGGALPTTSDKLRQIPVRVSQK